MKGWVGMLVLLAAGCSDGGGATTKTATPSANFAGEARTLFDTRCSVCHGTSGKGDAPGGATLVPKPRNFTDAAWQASVADAEIEDAIVGGGQAVGKSPLMPPNPDLQGKRGLVRALRDVVRSFAKK